MLPGFRFLCAAIVLTMSVLFFGLGAAALLRAAHEEFASIPLRRGPPETVFSRQAETIPTLALLRVEAPDMERPDVEKAPDNVPAAALPESPIAAPPPEPESVAALKVEDPAPSDTAKPDIPVAEAKPSDDAVPVQADAPAPSGETTIAAITDALPPASEAAPAAAEQAGTLASPDAQMASTKIATLGGPPVAIEAPPAAKPASAKPEKSAAQKRRAIERRRIAARARQAQQQPADLFAQPTITTRSR